MTQQIPDQELIDQIAWAINTAWNEFGEVPFPLYQHEAEALARAALSTVKAYDR